MYNVGNLFFVLIRDQTENKNLLMCTNLPLYELGCINATVASWQQRVVLKIVYATMIFLLTQIDGWRPTIETLPPWALISAAELPEQSALVRKAQMIHTEISVGCIACKEMWIVLIDMNRTPWRQGLESVNVQFMESILNSF